MQATAHMLVYYISGHNHRTNKRHTPWLVRIRRHSIHRSAFRTSTRFHPPSARGTMHELLCLVLVSNLSPSSHSSSLPAVLHDV